MEFEWSEEKLAIRESVQQICARYSDDYWLRKDKEGGFPEDFYREMVDAGYLGICYPEAYGGAGLGIQEAAIVTRTIAESGACMSGATAVHVNMFGLHPIVAFGTEEQKHRMLTPMIQGKEKACFGITEPNTGLNTTQLKTRAVREGDHYRVNGLKVWISTAQVADKIMLLTRTTALEDVKSPTHGLTLFYTKLDRNAVSVREIEKMGRKALDSNELFIEDLMVPLEDRIGEEGQGFKYILDGLNPERVLIAAEAVGIGYAALNRAANYARERVVFGRPIGQNQAIQHPLAINWCELEAAWNMVLKAGWCYDNRKPDAGVYANAAKYLAGEAGFNAAQRAVMTHGGMGYAKEYHVERYLREVMIPRLAPISPELALCFIAEKALEMPKSY
ncbi:acyl-CoA dehydrogenase family protein [Novosphingobium pentaromativorans]|uniref:Acyl-CoA dehydrogenase-like protein n=1 Tax=Novosphingobium pentaromativorans US6-1 TaxID=1088721 RepID=G6EGE0_9SPHN|nr:acyl-CoA dehydrogenase family protein [Novosphingobium pentaromativorans]AIT82133.1 acyl-CoA dehydrogenase [Novosphingobium pentaromativorans US6-1]EHJ59590.1 acyl-CoA dehydrogenase-like protein [Novosphingobium pentaromativorans US6-1]